jgi:hypothetical protein
VLGHWIASGTLGHACAVKVQIMLAIFANAHGLL